MDVELTGHRNELTVIFLFIIVIFLSGHNIKLFFKSIFTPIDYFRSQSLSKKLFVP